MGNLNNKLLAIQSELKAPKGQYNDFGKYKYRSCEDIMEAVKPITAKHQAVIVLSDDLVMLGDRFYVKATAKIIDAVDGSSLEVTAFAREELTKKGMDSSQITGSASSYARKYALNGLLAIDDTKDSDATNTGEHKEEKVEKPKEPENPEFATQEQIDVLKKNFKDKFEKLLEMNKIPDESKMPYEFAEKKIEALREIARQKQVADANAE